MNDPTIEDGAKITDDFLRPLFEGSLRHFQISRCRTCWAAVWRTDEVRHMAWHRGEAEDAQALVNARRSSVAPVTSPAGLGAPAGGDAA